LSAEITFKPASSVPDVTFQDEALMAVCIVAVWPLVRFISTAKVVVDPVFAAAHWLVLVIFRELPTKLNLPALDAVIVIGAAGIVALSVPGDVPTAAKYDLSFPFSCSVFAPSATCPSPPVVAFVVPVLIFKSLHASD
jgi:hypothetical protein